MRKGQWVRTPIFEPGPPQQFPLGWIRGRIIAGDEREANIEILLADRALGRELLNRAEPGLGDEVAARGWVLENITPWALDDRQFPAFQAALTAFKNAASELLTAWYAEDVPGDVLGDTYPDGWTDFQEELHKILEMRVSGS